MRNTNRKTLTEHMGADRVVYGSTGLRVYGSTGLRVYGSTGLRVYGLTIPAYSRNTAVNECRL